MEKNAYNQLENIEDIVDKIISYKNKGGVKLIEKYNYKYLIGIIEKQKISQLESGYREFTSKGADIIDFVRLFLNIIEHSEEETLFMVIATVDLFRKISENINLSSHVKFKHLTDLMCQSYGEQSSDQYLIPTMKLPEKNHFDRSMRIRHIDIDSAMVYGKNEYQLRRLKQGKIVTDSSKHNNSSIKLALYAQDIQMVLTLDCLSNKIQIYNVDCSLFKVVKPHQLEDQKEVIILSFAWSNRQRRLGSVLKDFSMIFWDRQDNFEFQKCFSTGAITYDYQTDIWYIDYMDTWLTTDRSHAINFWNLESESIFQAIKNQKVIKNQIIDIQSIEHMKLCAVGSIDKLVSIWDFQKCLCVLKIDLSQGGIQCLRYFHSYQVLLTCGYENTINLHTIDPTYLDSSMIGSLTGHTSMVTALTCIENSPMVISSDDCGIIKVWDIRDLKCIQTLELGFKTVITRLLDVAKEGKVCFIGSRVNFIQFTDSIQKPSENYHPVSVEYNINNEELVIATSKDIRFMDLKTGRIFKIYSAIFKNHDDEITIFKCINQFKKIVVGDYNGNLNIFSYATGELLNSLHGHQNEVSFLKIDYENQIFISGGLDSQVIFQQPVEKNKNVKLRRMFNMFHGKEIGLLDVSVYHNLIVVCSGDSQVFFYAYDDNSLVYVLTLPPHSTPTALAFINGFSLLLMATSDKRVHFLHFISQEQLFTVSPVSFIDLTYTPQYQPNYEEESPKIDQVSLFLKEKPEEREALSACKCWVNKLVLDIQYSRQGRANLEEEIENNSKTQKEKVLPNNCQLLLSDNQGKVSIYDIALMFQHSQVQLVPNANKKNNYNAFRHLESDFNKQQEKVKPEQKGSLLAFYQEESQTVVDISGERQRVFQAHKDIITSLQVMNHSQTNKLILTSGTDSYVKVWDWEGTPKASVNINHPLPIEWDIDLDIKAKLTKNILFSLKVVELIFRRHRKSILMTEEKLLSLNNFLNTLINKQEDKLFKQIQKSENEETNNQRYLMRDEYKPRDLQYQKVREWYKHELGGPSLKEMEANKRVQVAQKNWKNSDDDDTSIDKEEVINKDELTREKDPLAFFDPDYIKKLTNKHINHQLFVTQKFSVKLEQSLINKPTLNLSQRQDTPVDKPVQDILNNITNDKSQLNPKPSKPDFYEYANDRNLSVISYARNILDSSNTNNQSSSFLEEKYQFQRILKNLDKKLKESKGKNKRIDVEQIQSQDSFLKMITPQNMSNVSQQLPEIKQSRKFGQSLQKMPKNKQSLIALQKTDLYKMNPNHSNTFSTQDVSLYDQRADQILKAFHQKTEHSLQEIRQQISQSQIKYSVKRQLDVSMSKKNKQLPKEGEEHDSTFLTRNHSLRQNNRYTSIN